LAKRKKTIIESEEETMDVDPDVPEVEDSPIENSDHDTPPPPPPRSLKVKSSVSKPPPRASREVVPILSPKVARPKRPLPKIKKVAPPPPSPSIPTSEAGELISEDVVEVLPLPREPDVLPKILDIGDLTFEDGSLVSPDVLPIIADRVRLLSFISSSFVLIY
jgi:hypothetical protein